VANLRPHRGPLAVVVVALAAGCHSRGVPPVTTRLQVGARPFALAEVARRVGGDRVVVADQGPVVLGTGNLSDPWLDPVAMQRVTALAAETLGRADPAGRAAYQAGARVFAAQLAALDIDYRSSLADCARHDLVTADHAFAPMAARYGFRDHAATDVGVDAVVLAQGIGVVFTEPGVTSEAVVALARRAHTRVDQLDTLTAVTPDETARDATYLSLMTDNLAKLRTALTCTGGP
jgi:zinc transport system substrate-binding protein